MGRHGGPIPSKRQRLSTHVDPGSAPSSSPEKEDGGGAAGYCPRVRCVYYTPSFIAIAGPKPLPRQYRRLRLNEKWLNWDNATPPPHCRATRHHHVDAAFPVRAPRDAL